MFIGHYGVALGAYAVCPTVPLPLFMVATQAIDIVWAGCVLAGVEKVEIKPGATATTPLDLSHMPYSHSFAGAVLISLAMGALTLLFGLTAGAAALVCAVVFSHWLLDLLVHDRTLVIGFGMPKAGFGLWNNRPLSVVLEFALILLGIWLYWARFAPFDGSTTLLFAGFSGFAVLVQAMTFFGPPPKSPAALGVTMLTLFAVFTAASIWLVQPA